MDRLLTKDFLAGLLFVAFGALFLWLGSDLRLGTARSMGPGYVPRLLSLALIGLGALISVKALLSGSERPDPVRLRALVLILLGVAVFVFTFERLGLVPATIGLCVLSAMARPDWRKRETLVTTLVLVALCIAIFKIGLNMAFPVLTGVW